MELIFENVSADVDAISIHLQRASIQGKLFGKIATWHAIDKLQARTHVEIERLLCSRGGLRGHPTVYTTTVRAKCDPQRSSPQDQDTYDNENAINALVWQRRGWTYNGTQA